MLNSYNWGWLALPRLSWCCLAEPNWHFVSPPAQKCMEDQPYSVIRVLWEWAKAQLSRIIRCVLSLVFHFVSVSHFFFFLSFFAENKYSKKVTKKPSEGNLSPGTETQKWTKREKLSLPDHQSSPVSFPWKGRIQTTSRNTTIFSVSSCATPRHFTCTEL